jgi:GTP-binding protein
LTASGKVVEQGRVSKVLAFRGLERQPLKKALPATSSSIAGLTKATVADTLCAVEVTEAIEAQPIDPPTLSMTFRINDWTACRQGRRQGDKAVSSATG